MEKDLIEEIYKDCLKRLSHVLFPELEELFEELIKRGICALLSGEDPEKIMERVDEKLLEEVVRKYSRFEDFVEEMEFVAEKLYEYEDFEKVAKNLEKLISIFLKRVLKVYAKIVLEEREKSRRIARSSKLLSKINKAVFRMNDEKEFLKEVCRTIVNEGGYAYAWIGYFEEGGRVRVVADSGDGEYVQTIKLSLLESEAEDGSMDKAIRMGKSAVARYADGSHFFEGKEEILKRGFRSVATIPLHLEGRIIGILNIYSEKLDAFDKEEISLLEEFVENISHTITSLRRREELEKLYELVLENIGTPIIVIEDEKITFANSEMEKITGYSREELRGEPPTVLLPDSEIRELMRINGFRFANQTSVPGGCEIKYLDKEGKIRHAIMKTSTILGTNKLIVSLTDITEKKEVEERLRESEEKYRAVFEKAPLGIVLLSLDGTVLDCNEAALGMFGVRREDIIGLKWFELNLLDDELSKLLEEYHKGLHTSDLREFNVGVKVDEKLRWLRVFPTLLKKEDVPHAILLIIEDVNKMVILGKSLKYAFENMKVALEGIKILRLIDSGIIEGRGLRDLLLDALRAIRQKFGYDLLAIRVIEENDFVISDPEIGILKEINADEEILRNISEKEELNTLEIELLKTGFTCYALIPLIARGEKVGVLFAASKSKGMNTQFLRTFAGQLAIAIHEAVLFDMRMKAYEQIEKNIRQFAILVDQIRNPLAAAQGFVEIYVENGEAKKKIQEQYDRVVELVEQLEMEWLKSEALRKYLRKGRLIRGERYDEQA